MMSGKMPNWDSVLQGLSGSLDIRHANLAPLEHIYTNILVPQGFMDAAISVQPGLQLEGECTVENARSRPLGNIGPLREISAKLDFRGRSVEMKDARATIGMSPVNLSGEFDFSGTNWLAYAIPPLRLKITGTNVPL